VWDARLIAWGRRLRIDENAYCTVGRRKSDCDALDKMFASPKRSRCVLLFPENYMGASVLLATDEAPDFGDENPTISPKLAEYIATAGSLALRFANPEKYRAAAEGPTMTLFYGATSKIISVVENPEVDSIRIIQEPEGKRAPVADGTAETTSAEDEPAQE
ncbi:MAG: hypothetical protein HUK22_05855, partial [Thermoguttaceae bacterium]|nr:hypothetical protein [Thermoguttaceae bacterium]